jgi:hypothetical protein
LTIMASAAVAALPPDPGEADIAWVATGEFCEPETVLPLPDNTLLVSNVCGIHATGNGFLTLLDANGQVLDWRKVEGLDAPLGMARLDAPLGMARLADRLYLVDNNRLKIFRWPGYELLETIELQTSVANESRLR